MGLKELRALSLDQLLACQLTAPEAYVVLTRLGEVLAWARQDSDEPQVCFLWRAPAAASLALTPRLLLAGLAAGLQECAAARPPLCPAQAALHGRLRWVERRGARPRAQLGAHAGGRTVHQRGALHADFQGAQRREWKVLRSGSPSRKGQLACSPTALLAPAALRVILLLSARRTSGPPRRPCAGRPDLGAAAQRRPLPRL